jgi:tartronate-semialdehyde synthase
VFQQAFHLMRSGRPGPVLIDLPFDVQMAEIEFDPIPTSRCRSTSRQGEPCADRKSTSTMLNDAERPLITPAAA